MSVFNKIWAKRGRFIAPIAATAIIGLTSLGLAGCPNPTDGGGQEQENKWVDVYSAEYRWVEWGDWTEWTPSTPVTPGEGTRYGIEWMVRDHTKKTREPVK